MDVLVRSFKDGLVGPPWDPGQRPWPCLGGKASREAGTCLRSVGVQGGCTGLSGILGHLWSGVTMVSRLSPGILKVVLLLFASVCAWYSGYLLAELIPEGSLSSAVYSFQSIGDRPVLKGEHPGVGPANNSAAPLQR